MDVLQPKRKLKRALNAKEISKIKEDELGFDGDFYDGFGRVPTCCSMLIYGESGAGKSTLTMQLAKYLCRWANDHGRVHYGAFEERMDSTSFRRRVMSFDMPKSFQAVTESWDDFKERVSRRQSAHFLIIDSADDALRTVKRTERVDSMKQFVDDHPHKFIIIIGHGKGSKPNALSEELEFKVGIKVLVRDGIALVKSRFLEEGCSGRFEIRRELYERNTSVGAALRGRPEQETKNRKQQEDDEEEY